MNNNDNNQNNDNKENISKQEQISDKLIKMAENIMTTDDKSSNFVNDEAKKYKTNAVLCYLGPLIILPFVNKLHTKSEYMKFHMNQGLNVILLFIIVFIFTGILTSLFKEVSFYSSYTPAWVSFINFILYFLVLAFDLIGLFNTISDKSVELPIIGKFRFIK